MSTSKVKFQPASFGRGEQQAEDSARANPCSSRPGFFAWFIALFLLLSVTGSATAAIINEPMNSAAASGWVLGGSANFTASTGVDPEGSGWLRLTEPTTNQAGFAMLNSAFDLSQGGVIQFEYATWGGNGADGYSIYLFDGNYDALSFAVGASGGSLGYDKKTVSPVHAGLTGGYIGVGIDEYGNFSNPSEGRSGGPGLRANSVAVRGPFNHPTAPYYYLGGTAANVGTLWFNQAYRPNQTSSSYRKVVIYLTPAEAPDYMRVDVYLQFGYNQPLTQVITGLYTGTQIPATVKVGYAASTGGSTNYHEIRNLSIDPLPTDINLGVATTVSAPSVAPGGALTYTVAVRNYGPAVTTATDIPVISALPIQLIGATWSCSGNNGGICGAASGSGSLNTVATLPFNGDATYTITGTVDPATPLGTVIRNTASLSVPAGIFDYSPLDNKATADTTVSSGTVTVAGTVYNDSGIGGGTAHNGIRDGSETGLSAGMTYYAKIFRSSDLSTTVAAPVRVDATSGTYSFSGIPAYGSFTIILSSTVTANLYDPAFPGTEWTPVSPANLALGNVVTVGSNLANQDFFLFNGSRISGKVVRDDGSNGSFSNAYDGVHNGAETGIPGVVMTLRDDGDTTTYDSSITDSKGKFTLFTDVASATLRIYETNLADYSSVSYNQGTTAGTYTIDGEYIRFAYTRLSNYSGVIFGDVPPVVASFSPLSHNANGTPNAPVYHAHTFTATGRGTVSFSASGRTQTGWPAVSHVLDSNCNGRFDAAEPDISAGISVVPGQNVCILTRVIIPVGVVAGSADLLVTRATLTTGLAAPLTSDVSDTTGVLNYAGSGSIPLYLYDTPKLSRTANGSTAAISIGKGGTVSFPMSPAAAGPITISPAVSSSIPVQLIVMRASKSGTRSVTVNLRCGSNGTVFSDTQSCTADRNYNLCSFNLPLAVAETCPAGGGWNLDVTNNSGTDGIRVYPYNAGLGSYSMVTLPTTTVINVDYTGFHDADYAGGTALSSAVPGSTVYIRSVVSNPFGSYDIFPDGGTAPTLTIKDPAGSTLVDAATMTMVATGNETPSLTRTFEYAYAIPSAPLGDWSLQVVAAQGTEGAVSNSRYTTMPVVLPSLTLTIVGSGSVHGISAQGQIYACGNGSCPTASFAYNDTVTLTATGSNSTFTAWSGDYSGSSNPGSFVMDRSRDVIATFIPIPARVRIDGDPTPFYALNTALAVPDGSATIRAEGISEFINNVVMDNPAPLTLKGGYSDADFISQDRYTIIRGSLTIREGKLTVDRLIIRP